MRLRVRVRGLVQGVGFRPFVFRLAEAAGLTGWVSNDGDGVLLEVQGPGAWQLVARLELDAPPLARIHGVGVVPIAFDTSESTFRIIESRLNRVTTGIVPDASICDACLSEMLSPDDRRFLYPFLNCTHCGPRYTATRGLPYDRPMTSMAGFPLCEACRLEYENPGDRRFHAQPVACPSCGPSLSSPPARIIEAIREGGIVSIKGLGGYHLACDARNARAVRELRERKDRDTRPFALMAPNLASSRRVVETTPATEALLCSPERPIVLLPRLSSALLPAEIAPGLRTLGVMLPYTPLHYLLLYEAAGRPEPDRWRTEAQPELWVMTSANPGGEPIVKDDEEAGRRLAGLHDVCLSYDREIVVRTDDSVVQVLDGAPMFVRRARGYVPAPIQLSIEVPPIIALGADLKNTFCVARGRQAFVSQHIGDLDNRETVFFLQETIAHLCEILEISPEHAVRDLHPEFISSRVAEDLELPVTAVQHHHAHVASVVAEHKVDEPVLGVALDGYGLGANGGLWGGELLLLDRAGCERVGHLAELRQPGGDRAAREPWRMAAAALKKMGRVEQIALQFGHISAARSMGDVLANDLYSPRTSSCGRLFDAACGLLGVLEVASYEGEAPMRLEALVCRPEAWSGGYEIDRGLVLEFLPLLERLTTCHPRAGAELFHGTMIEGLAEWIREAAGRYELQTVALSGGCCHNKVLMEGLIGRLEDAGLRVLVPRALPPNDGGLSLGQVWVAGMQLASG